MRGKPYSLASKIHFWQAANSFYGCVGRIAYEGFACFNLGRGSAADADRLSLLTAGSPRSSFFLGDACSGILKRIGFSRWVLWIELGLDCRFSSKVCSQSCDKIGLKSSFIFFVVDFSYFGLFFWELTGDFDVTR